MKVWVWLALLVLFMIFEALTAGLTTIWFAGGALAAILVSFVGAGMVVQIFAFLLVSVLLLVFTRPLAVKYLNNKAPKTNVEGIIGRTAVVEKEINNLKAEGSVLIDGMPWSARTPEDGTVIAAGETVVVKEVRGVKCIVEKEA